MLASTNERGIFVIEVESHSAGVWAKSTEWSGYLGESFYVWKGGTADANVLSYTFRIAQAGWYSLSLRNRYQNPDVTEENDAFSRIDGREWLKTGSHSWGESQRWNWDTWIDPEHNALDPTLYAPAEDFGGVKFIKPATYYLEAGDHVFELKGRSVGFGLDRLHVYPKDMGESALNETLHESPIVCEP